LSRFILVLYLVILWWLLSDTKLLFISDKNIYRKLQPVLSNIESIEAVYTFNDVEDAENWVYFIQKGKDEEERIKSILEQRSAEISPDDLHTIIYTSGTTGNPKGVMLTHRNILSNALAVYDILPVQFGHKALSFLPLCHVYERMVNYSFQIKGIRIYYAESMGTIVDNLKEVKPHIFNSVPRLLEKFYDKIIAIGKDLRGIKRHIFFWAIRLGVKYKSDGNNSAFYNAKLKLARKLVFSKWQAAFGGNVIAVVSGGSSLQERLNKLFHAAGVPICEGYGLSETSPVLAVNWPDFKNKRIGTVGPVLEGVTIKIADDGEILAKGVNVMKGYYKNPEETAKVFDEEGWFHTGDIGTWIEGRFLKITDRKKEIFKTSSGKYVAPQVIENMFKASSLIEQIMIVGENEKFVSALISPNFNYLHFWATKHKIHYRDNPELIRQPQVIQKIQHEIDMVNKTLGEHEKIKRFRLVHEEWSPASGELSPTLKLKRNVIYAKYENILSEIYGHGVDKTEKMGKETGGDSIDKIIANGLSKLMNITITGKDKDKE
ncbi:MAG TPA: long-chain fatty acid--CoA ligase, partial [Bacteroidales bacterium]|nr:long-chain fatty acid--CoA ligase [Bacteroidales bacterium]